MAHPGLQIRRPLHLALFCAAAGANCTPGAGGGTLQPHPAFQLTYIDQNDQVRVRYSDDGVTWASGALSAQADGGVGASSSPDVAGISRLVADGGLTSRLRLWFGLGPETWDATPVALPGLLPAHRPTIVDIGGSRYLIAFLPANSLSFELWLYDHNSRQATPVPVSAAPGNDLLHASPAMAYLPADPAAGRNWGRVALAWGRYQTPTSTEPFEIRTLFAALDPQGPVTTGGGFFVIRSDSLDSFTYFGPIPHLLSEPALAHDHTKFFLASHQRFLGVQPTTRPAEYVRIHTSPDGQSWTTRSWIDFTGTRVQDDPGRVEFALQPDCRAVLVIIPTTAGPAHAQLHLPSGTDQTIPPTDIFGTELPGVRQFALIATGQPGSVSATGCTAF
jgi:hypothetical protein